MQNVRAWRRSGRSARAFAAEHGISEATLCNWGRGVGSALTPEPTRTSHMENEKMPDPMHRSFREVFDDHLRLSKMGDFETDLRRKFSIDVIVHVIVLMENKVYRGHEEVRGLAKRLLRELRVPSVLTRPDPP